MTPHDRRHMARLRDMAERADHQAVLMDNSSLNEEGMRMAGKLRDEAHAIRWALRRIEPELEGVGQTFAELRRAGE